MIPDQDVFLLRGKLAVRVDARTALYLAKTDSSTMRHALGLAFVDGMAWFVQHLHWSVRGGRASYWPALKILYREVRRRKASPQKLRSLAGGHRSKSSHFAWGTPEFQAEQVFTARYQLLNAHQRACELAADQLMAEAWPRGWWVHRRDSAAQRVLIAKRALHGVAVEVAIRWRGHCIDLQALTGEPQTGYDPSDSFDRMKLWKRRVLFHRQVYVERGLESDPAQDEARLASYRGAVSQALRDLQQEIVAIQPDLQVQEEAVPA